MSQERKGNFQVFRYFSRHFAKSTESREEVDASVKTMTVVIEKKPDQSRNFPLYNSWALEIVTVSIHVHVFIPQASYIMHWIHIFMTDMTDFFSNEKTIYISIK